MSIESLRLMAALVCVATNAYPLLSKELLARVSKSESEQTAAPGILEVLRLHGGERFGEKDNTNELSVLQKWTDHCIRSFPETMTLQCVKKPPSFCDLFDVLLSGDKHSRSWSPAYFAANETELFKDGRRDKKLKELLAQKWKSQERSRTSIPSLVFVKGSLTVPTLVENVCIDFCAGAGSGSGSCTDADAEGDMLRQAQLENAQRSFVDCQNVLKSIGIVEPQDSCQDLQKSLLAVRRWISLATEDSLFEQWKSILEGVCPLLVSELSSEPSIWETIIARASNRQAEARGSLEALERRPKYVLRAFIVKNPLVDEKSTNNGNGNGNGNINNSESSLASFTIVRRFGKAEGASHFSILTSDGWCWPTRKQDIKGTVVESMWVCCNDDNECISAAPATDTDTAVTTGAGAAGKENGVLLAGPKSGHATAVSSGINTVVADPDDDIYCDICLELSSYSYDQIIICDKCERGVHQMCHIPIVTEDEVTQDQWFCSKCRPKNKTKSPINKRSRTRL
ncbi:mitochondrial transcription factor 2 [Coemansia asiatica]|uniref:Mitochondrial transcription factor 2 n=1 Tax=Coemansia asiatica TaxID=1052880 RepID=A0A9W8CHG4_9FUNG|nr:mitochondrial transcription factor 2 [Coemansia asiatica]